ncbi:hypothetical protein AB0G15_42480 [Streptosporangium sp. NPDC023825]
MARQIAMTYQPPSVAGLEARIHDLEIQVTHLTELVEALIQAPTTRS